MTISVINKCIVAVLIICCYYVVAYYYINQRCNGTKGLNDQKRDTFKRDVWSPYPNMSGVVTII